MDVLHQHAALERLAVQEHVEPLHVHPGVVQVAGAVVDRSHHVQLLDRSREISGLDVAVT